MPLSYYFQIYFTTGALTAGVIAGWWLLGLLGSTGRPRSPRQEPPKLTLAPIPCQASVRAQALPDRPHQATAVSTLSDLRRMTDPQFPVVISVLRKMNAYAFEELLAICLAERGLQGYCSSGYSRDGGVDALAFYQGRPVVVQAKRWKRHISAHDVRALAAVAERVAGIGLFVHTGRTGRASWRAARARRVNILSGGDLVRFVLGREVAIRWETPEPRSDETPLPISVQSALEFARQVPPQI